jgi:hypothetical protein
MANLAVMSGTHSGTYTGRGGRFVSSFPTRGEHGRGMRGEHDAKQGQAQLPYGLFSYAKWLFFWERTSENAQKAKFVEFLFHALR